MSYLIYLKEKTKYLFLKENIFYLSFVAIIFFLDRLSKLKIVNNFSETSYYVNDYINIDLIWNIGIGFGFFSTDSNLLYGLITPFIGQ